jgi:hypothetical protein
MKLASDMHLLDKSESPWHLPETLPLAHLKVIVANSIANSIQLLYAFGLDPGRIHALRVMHWSHPGKLRGGLHWHHGKLRGGLTLVS